MAAAEDTVSDVHLDSGLGQYELPGRVPPSLNYAANPDSGFAGGINVAPLRPKCQLRARASESDPANFEHYVELLRQGSAASLRVAVASRALQREGHRTHLLAKAALGAAYSILDDPMRLYTSPEWAQLPAKELRRNRRLWNEGFRELYNREYPPETEEPYTPPEQNQEPEPSGADPLGQGTDLRTQHEDAVLSNLMVESQLEPKGLDEQARREMGRDMLKMEGKSEADAGPAGMADTSGGPRTKRAASSWLAAPPPAAAAPPPRRLPAQGRRVLRCRAPRAVSGQRAWREAWRASAYAAFL